MQAFGVRQLPAAGPVAPSRWTFLRHPSTRDLAGVLGGASAVWAANLIPTVGVRPLVIIVGSVLALWRILAHWYRARAAIHAGAAAGGDQADNRRLHTVISELTDAQRRQHRLSAVFGSSSAIAAAGGIGLLVWQASKGIETIKDLGSAEDVATSVVVAETAYLIVRGTGLAAVIAAIIYFVLGLTRSSLDQATRYEKRLIASHLIDYALHEPDLDQGKLDAAHKIIEVWGSTVESAYTPPRVARRAGSFELSGNKDGGSIKTDHGDQA